MLLAMNFLVCSKPDKEATSIVLYTSTTSVRVGPCTFVPFRRRRRSKTNCHLRKSISHYSFWNLNTANSGDSQPCTQTNRSFGLQWSLKVLHVRYVNELWNMIHMSHPQEQWAPQAAVWQHTAIVLCPHANIESVHCTMKVEISSSDQELWTTLTMPM